MINDENTATLGGVAGDRINISVDGRRPSSFSLKTVRTIYGVDGDQLDKFDWHTVICRNQAIVEKVSPGMRVRVRGAITTTAIAKSAIIASQIELETGDRWPDAPDDRRRRRE